MKTIPTLATCALALALGQPAAAQDEARAPIDDAATTNYANLPDNCSPEGGMSGSEQAMSLAANEGLDQFGPENDRLVSILSAAQLQMKQAATVEDIDLAAACSLLSALYGALRVAEFQADAGDSEPLATAAAAAVDPVAVNAIANWIEAQD